MANIKLYGTKTCSFCKVAKEFFEDKKIAFEYVDVGEDAEARKYIIEASGQMGVPVIKIDDKILIGWKRTQVEKALGINQD